MNPDARLRRSLAPVDPPDGFAQRVRARVERERRPVRRVPLQGVARWVAVAAALFAVVGGPVLWRQYETRREALAARAQVLLALQIASHQLNSVHRQVVRPSSPRLQAVPAGATKEGRP
jgi:hypothetical protein